MKLVSIDSLNQALLPILNSSAAVNSPATFAWKGLQLNQSHQSQTQAIELDGPFASALFQAKPFLGLKTLVHLRAFVESQAQIESAEFEQVLLNLKIKPSSQNIRVLERLEQFPPEFLDWCEQKKCKPGDLIFILSLDHLSEAQQGFEYVAASHASLSNGLKALEMWTELTLMGKAPIPTSETDFESWLKELSRIRFPLSQQREDSSQAKLAKVSWPARVQTKWVNSKDADSLQIRIEVRSQKDLKNKLSQLNRIADQMETDDPWRT